jgi:acyl-CoA synthetase (AMP-forming)/AMP-acid ligase II
MPEDAGSDLLFGWITRAAQAEPDKPWVIAADDGRVVTYAQLREMAGRFASFLHEHKLGPNDRVALLANNSIEQLLCYLGVMAAGPTICTIHVEMNRARCSTRCHAAGRESRRRLRSPATTQ